MTIIIAVLLVKQCFSSFEISVNITKSVDSFIGIRMWHILMNVQWE
jgi:hypothetical protein